jgi:hypothetical protein
MINHRFKKNQTKAAMLLCFFISISWSASAQKKNVDGKVFSVKLKVEGETRLGRKWDQDELTFKDGALISKEMSEHESFGPFNCTFTKDSASNGKIYFKASGSNTAVSSIEWEGTIDGDVVEGRAVWTNANGPQTQRFSGKLKLQK